MKQWGHNYQVFTIPFSSAVEGITKKKVLVPAILSLIYPVRPVSGIVHLQKIPEDTRRYYNMGWEEHREVNQHPIRWAGQLFISSTSNICDFPNHLHVSILLSGIITTLLPMMQRLIIKMHGWTSIRKYWWLCFILDARSGSFYFTYCTQ